MHSDVTFVKVEMEFWLHFTFFFIYKAQSSLIEWLQNLILFHYVIL